MPHTTIAHIEYMLEAYEWALDHTDPDATRDEIDAMAEKHYEWICNEEGVEPYE